MFKTFTVEMTRSDQLGEDSPWQFSRTHSHPFIPETFSLEFIPAKSSFFNAVTVRSHFCISTSAGLPIPTSLFSDVLKRWLSQWFRQSFDHHSCTWHPQHLGHSCLVI